MPRFVFIDTEATGLDHRRHELTEVAWIVRFEDGVEETRQFFPEHTLDGAEPAALELTHYHDRIGPRPRTPATVWLRQLLADAAGGHLVGAVPDFDAHHLELMCHKLGLVPSWDHHLIDVGTLALPLIADQPEGPRSLAKTCRALGVPHDDNLAHGALYDAQQAMRAFDATWDRLAKLRADGAPLPDAVPRTGGNGNGPRVDLVEVTDRNWRDVADVAPRIHQQQFVFPSAARYLLLADRSEWHSLGIVFERHVVGHVMHATEAMDDPAEDVDWIGGLVIDRRHQGRGFGTAAMRALLERLGDREVRITVHPDNHTAQRMWRSFDFHPTDERDDEEFVWVRPAPGHEDDSDGGERA